MCVCVYVFLVPDVAKILGILIMNLVYFTVDRINSQLNISSDIRSHHIHSIPITSHYMNSFGIAT